MRMPPLIHRLLLLISPGFLAIPAPAAKPPNILWLTSEDHGPHMGCYGDSLATTPHMDALAARGMIYDFVWSNAPVCAPARTTLLTGMHAPALGAGPMRSGVSFPRDRLLYPQLLRRAGYYCTNNSKEDYNIDAPDDLWDESSTSAHWKNRAPGQPFFAIFNSTRSHESRIRERPHTLRHDPARIRLPAYHPDTPEVRHDWAQYYDAVSAADAEAGARLAELEAAGLADDTIVFYYADHGPGMPRAKRWPFDSGLRVPLIVYIPERFADLRPPEYRAGGRSRRLVSFVDLAPTVLSLAGIAPPDWMQGSAFLGRPVAPPPAYVHGYRGRMDERIDLVRSVSDGRYIYIRNYMPHRIYGQHIAYMFETPTTQVWKQLHEAGKLTPVQARFWQPKPPEELYDLENDPDEVNNLADDPTYADIKARLRAAQQAQARRIRDLGFLPEHELFTRHPGVPPVEWAGDDAVYPFDRIFAIAELAADLAPAATARLIAALEDPDSAVRYWAALGLLMRGSDGVTAAADALRIALSDTSPAVRAAAAEALVAWGRAEDLDTALATLLDVANPANSNALEALPALAAIDALGEKAAPIWPAVGAFDPTYRAPHRRYAEYPARILAVIRRRMAAAGVDPATAAPVETAPVEAGEAGASAPPAG